MHKECSSTSVYVLVWAILCDRFWNWTRHDQRALRSILTLNAKTVQWLSLTIRCREIDGHSEIDLRPRRGMRGHEKKKCERLAGKNKVPGLIKFQSSCTRSHINTHIFWYKKIWHLKWDLLISVFFIYVKSQSFSVVIFQRSCSSFIWAWGGVGYTSETG